VTPIIAGHWEAAEEELSRWADSVATYLPDGRAPRTGQIYSNPNLAKSYRTLADEGPDAFYEGSIAQQIIQFSEANSGFFSAADFVDHQSQWIDPVSTEYRGFEIWELPPNGQGIAALQILNLLEDYDLAGLGAENPEYLHLLIEAKKLAFADRARFYADPDAVDVPVEQLISKQYAARRRNLIDPTMAAINVPHGDPKLATGDTIYLSVVDKQRNCCSLIQSNFHGFGSMVVPGDVGFALQNRGALFALDDEHPNRLAPHKRPFHTIIPAMAMKDSKPWLCFGVMGGDMQPQGHVQILINMIDFGMNVQQAGEAPRVRHMGSASPTGIPAEQEGGKVYLEPGFAQDVIECLIRKGHHAETKNTGFGGYQAVMIDHEQGSLHGGSDPRKDGCAMGY